MTHPGIKKSSGDEITHVNRPWASINIIMRKDTLIGIAPRFPSALLVASVYRYNYGFKFPS